MNRAQIRVVFASIVCALAPLAGIGASIANIAHSTPINGDSVTVTADVTGTPIAVYVVYQSLAGTSDAFTESPMTQSEGATYTGVIPAMAAGTVNYFIRVIEENAAPTESVTNAYVVADVPGEERYVDWEGWVKDTSPDFGGVRSTNYLHACANGGTWTASGILYANRGTMRPGGTPPSGYFAAFYNYPESSAQHVTSPILAGGVGTIFYCTEISGIGGNGELKVQVSTMAEPQESDWITVKTLVFPIARVESEIVSRAEPIVINRYDIQRVRIIRSKANEYSTDTKSGYIGIDEIVISRPPAKAVLAERLRTPGYPSRDQQIKLRAFVSNECEETPAINRRMKVWYQWVLRATDLPTQYDWVSADMTDMGTNLFEVVLEEQESGYIWYYFQCDFDGYVYGRDPDLDYPEPYFVCNKSPVFFANGQNYESDPKVLANGIALDEKTSRFQVREYRSPDAQIVQEATLYPVDESAEPVVKRFQMDLVGDNEWQALVPIDAYRKIESRFYAHGHYVDDAFEFASEPMTWAINEQDMRNAPLGGFLYIDGTNSLVAEELEADTGSLLHRFSTASGAFMVKRAVYQNFNEWQASQYNYEESLGGSETVTITTNFNGVEKNVYREGEKVGTRFYDSDLSLSTVGFDRTPIRSSNLQFVRANSRAFAERKTVFGQTANVAVGLEPYYGSLMNTQEGVTHGVERFEFAARATLDDGSHAIYKDGLSWGIGVNATPFVLTANFDVTQLGPANAYVSFLVAYQRDSWDPSIENYYEVRFVQGDSHTASSADRTIYVELWRHLAGSAPYLVNRSYAKSGSLSIIRTVKMAFFNDNSSNKIKYYIDYDGNMTIPGFSNSELWGTDSAPGVLINGGTIGVGAFDAVPNITSIMVSGGSASPANESLLGTAYLSNWYNGGTRAGASSPRWNVAAGSLSRTVPEQTLELWSAPYENGDTAADPSAMTLKETFTVNSLSYRTMRADFKTWNGQFVELRYADGAEGLVVDDPAISPWRAWTFNINEIATSSAPYLWETYDEQAEWFNDSDDWMILQGQVTNTIGAVGHDLTFEVSRANPVTDEDAPAEPIQALISPKLHNGLGSIKFSAKSFAGRCVYVIEATDPLNTSVWYPQVVFTNTYVAGQENYENRYWKIGQVGQSMSGVPIPGRIRIRMLPESSSADAKLVIDNVTVKDFPPRDSSTWLAWNARITDLSDGVIERIYSEKSCYLNNSLVNGCANEDFSDHEPFVQSPQVETGIGEISFQYRSYGVTTNNAATLVIKVAPHDGVPDENWKTITNMTVSGTGYVQFKNSAIFDQHNKVVRFYSSTNAAERICLDNILITEPVRASYEFFRVSLLPEQPLVGTPAAVEAEIGRFLMNPEDVKIYVSYHVGTNLWGYTNWWTRADTPGSRRIELARVGDEKSRLFRSEELLPATAIDDVVQYVAWGVHKEIGADDPVIFQTENAFRFAVPSSDPEAAPEMVDYVPWYLPVNLNASRASDGWSPYYYVFSCPPGAVWFNEIFFYMSSKDLNVGDFVELLGASSSQIGGWRIEFVDANANPYGFENIVLPTGTTLKPVGNGWGVFVIGDSNVSPAADIVVSDFGGMSALFGTYGRGGLALYRSMGACEQKICWHRTASNARTLIDLGYEYIGYRWAAAGDTYYSISLVSDEHTIESGSSSYDDLTWNNQKLITSGNLNVDEVMLDIEVDGEKYWLISVLDGPYGTQNGKTETIRQELPNGATTNLTFVANDWYRIRAIKQNGAAINGVEGQKVYQMTVTMTGNISNHVEFAEYRGDIPADIPTSWLTRYTEVEIAQGDDDEFSLMDEYLLGTDPTKTSIIDFGISEIMLDASNVYLTTRLSRADMVDGVAVPVTDAINGKINFYGTSDLANWPDTPVSVVDYDDLFLGTGDGEIGTEIPLGTDRFWRAVIE